MHNIHYITAVEDCNRRKIYEEICDHAENDGDGYSGMGPRWHTEVAPLRDYDAAYDWIRAHDNGWYDDHAVRYYDYSGNKTTKKIEELKKRQADLYRKRLDYEKAHSVTQFKAEYIGCPKCGSKLARKHLRSEKCPLCYTDMRGKTTLDTIANYEKRRKEIEEQIKVEQAKQKGKVMWLIKYEYHS